MTMKPWDFIAYQPKRPLLSIKIQPKSTPHPDDRCRPYLIAEAIVGIECVCVMGGGRGVGTGLRMTLSFTDMNRGSSITKRKKIHDLCVSPVLLTRLFLDGTSDQSKINK